MMRRSDSVKLAVDLAKSVCVPSDNNVWTSENVSDFIKVVASTIYEEATKDKD